MVFSSSSPTHVCRCISPARSTFVVTVWAVLLRASIAPALSPRAPLICLATHGVDPDVTSAQADGAEIDPNFQPASVNKPPSMESEVAAALFWWQQVAAAVSNAVEKKQP